MITPVRSRALVPRLLIAATALLASACGEAKKAPPPPPPTVLVTPVTRRDVPIVVEAVGSLDGYVNAEIRARVRGFLASQQFKDGAFVKEGQLLFTIDPAEYVNAIASAKATLDRAVANQAHNKAQLERYRALAPSGTVSQQELDNAVAAEADANGQIEAARAQLQQAQLNLSYTKIHSPVSGLAGLALVRVGNLVGQDAPTLLTTVSQVDPIRANFPISEVDYIRAPERVKRLADHDVAWARAQFAALEHGGTAEGGDPGVELVLADGSVYPHRGVIVSANRQVDPSTGTIQLQALFPNEAALLRPGQYARVRIATPHGGDNVLAVPDKALVSVQGTYSVGVVGPDDKVQLRRVDVGPSAGGLRIVTKGLAEGDRIVVEGVQKISDGARVIAQPAPEVASTPAPKLSAEPPPAKL